MDEYEPAHYEVISLAEVRFESLDALERNIEAAARLRVTGVGK
jgi:hypothetical protein